MVDSLILALAQHDFAVGAVASNAAKIDALMHQARAKNADLLLCPELALCGYPPEDLLLRPAFLESCQQALQELAAASTGLAALVGFPHREGEQLYNAAALLCDRRVAQVAHKQVLPNYGVFDDKRYFYPGTASTVITRQGVRIGVLICEDVWSAQPAMRAAHAGAQLIVVVNASPWDQSKQIRRETRLCLRARETGCAIAYLNLVGAQDEVVYDGTSLLINADGTVAARAPAFIDTLLMVCFDPLTRRLHADSWPPQSVLSQEALLYAALVRGISDYVNKNNFQGVLLGLSGGIDSALTLALAVDALGAEHVTAVMMPSCYTSALSRDVAYSQAISLGVDYQVLEVDPVMAAFMTVLKQFFAGKATNTTEENLQSRIRGTMLMALSNKHGKLLLSTGNKSEMAVGYCTLYGDMCGAYAPLKDIYKTMVYRLSRWRNAQKNGREVIPAAIIERPPSAELRAEQTDQDSLPAYEELDAILERFIEGDQSQAHIIAAGFPVDTVHRVARMVFANEFKRRQAAPGPRVSTRAFGRERRYPISSAWR